MRTRTFRPSKRWWKAYGSLYGEQLELNEPEKKPIKKKPAVICPTEAEEQIIVATWLTKKNIPFYHIPNGGYRNAREGAKFKALGVRAGVPDLCICQGRKSFLGLYLEVKRQHGGVLSDAQKCWRDILVKEGYAWHEGKGAQECIKIISEYLDIN